MSDSPSVADSVVNVVCAVPTRSVYVVPGASWSIGWAYTV